MPGLVFNLSERDFSNFLTTDSLGLEEFNSPTNEQILAKASPLDSEKARLILEPRYPDAYQLMKRVGVHPDSGIQEFLNPISGKVVREDFSNIGNHLSCVGLVADSLCSALVEAGALSPAQHHCITERALMHDAAKPYQIFLIRAIRDGSLSQEDFYSPKIDLYYERCIEHLIANGLAEREARLVFFDYGSETGSEPERMKDFIEADSNGLKWSCPASLEAQLVHLSDDMVGSTKPSPGNPARNVLLTTRERVLLTQPRDISFQGWRVGLVLNRSGQPEYVGDIKRVEPGVKVLGSSYGLQIWASDYVICNKIARLLGLQVDMSQAASSIKELVKSQIEKYS